MSRFGAGVFNNTIMTSALDYFYNYYSDGIELFKNGTCKFGIHSLLTEMMRLVSHEGRPA
jgi:hypothetical protein